MGKYLYQINSDIGQIVCRFAGNKDGELGLREEGFRELKEFTLEEKVNAAFMSAAYLDERIDNEVSSIEATISGLGDAVDDLEEDLEDLDWRLGRVSGN